MPLALYWILTWTNSNLNFKDAWLNFLKNPMTLQQVLMITFVLGIWAWYSICKMLQNARNIKVVSKDDPIFRTQTKKTVSDIDENI